jgi:hypothetical protein
MDLADDVVVLPEVSVPGSHLVLRVAAPRNAGDKKRLGWGDEGSGGVLWDAAHILNALLVAHPTLVVRAPRQPAFFCGTQSLRLTPLDQTPSPWHHSKSIRTRSTIPPPPMPPNGACAARSQRVEAPQVGSTAGGVRWELLGMDMSRRTH